MNAYKDLGSWKMYNTICPRSLGHFVKLIHGKDFRKNSGRERKRIIRIIKYLRRQKLREKRKKVQNG